MGIGDSGVMQVSGVEEGNDTEAVGGRVLKVRGPTDREGLFLCGVEGDIWGHESIGHAEG